MEELAPDDPLNVFHEIFHRHVAVIKRFGRFPHRNKILQRVSTVAEEDFLENSSFRFDLPLIRRSDGTFAFAGAVKKRTVKLLDHEYETLLPDLDEVGHRAFEFNYLGPDGVFTKTQEQLRKQGYIRIGDSVPDFTAETSMGPINFHEFIGDSWCVFFSHPADFTPVCTTEFGVTAKLGEEWHEGHRSERRQRWRPRALDRGHQRDAAHPGELPDHRGQGSSGVDALRHARLHHVPPRL
jgi:hypothetical protein